MAFNAAVGATTLVLDGVLPVTAIHKVWLTWWLGDALGALIVGPALLTLRVPERKYFGPKYRREILLAWVGLFVTAMLCVTPLSPFQGGLPPMLPFPFVIWLALRQYTFHATWGVLVLNAMVLWGVLGHTGSFVGAQGEVDLAHLWTYMFVLGIIGLLITALHSESALALSETRRSESRLKEAQRIAHIGHWDWDIRTDTLWWSDEIYRILGRRPQEFAATYKAFVDTIHPDDRAAVESLIDTVLTHREPCSTEHRIVLPSNEVRTVREHIVGEFDPAGMPLRVAGTVQDITERRELERKLEQEARTDPLTGCVNRRYFLEQATHELARARRYGGLVSVLLLDLDHFKTVNDRYGHQIGDTTLQKLVRVCDDTLREEDVVGRLGGEEFAVLLPETSNEKAVEVAERLREAIAATDIPLHNQAPLNVTTSIGVATLEPGISAWTGSSRAPTTPYMKRRTWDETR